MNNKEYDTEVEEMAKLAIKIVRENPGMNHDDLIYKMNQEIAYITLNNLVAQGKLVFKGSRDGELLYGIADENNLND